MAMRMVIPHLPARELNPNSRNYHMQKNRHFQAAKDEMVAEVRSRDLRQDPLWGHVALEFVYHAGDRRRRDVDNLLAASKAWIDGLVGEVIPDDSGKHVSKLSGQYVLDDTSYTEVVIRRIKD